MMKILWLTNIPSPYRVNFFNELGKYCDLTVLFERKGSNERDNSWLSVEVKNFNAVFLKGKKTGVAEAFCPSVGKYIKRKKYDSIVVTNYSDLTGIYAIFLLKLKRIPYCIEGDGAFAGSGKGLKEKIKRWLLKKSQICFSTAEEHDKYYKTYGVAQNKIVRYPFTSLYDRDILLKPVLVSEKQSIREKLGIKKEKVIISVGQFIHRKGFDVLIKASAELKDFGVYIIGGNPTTEYTKLLDEFSLNNVHFIGFQNKQSLGEYYKASDIFVLPTREDIWGLVINEAMSKGLPVVTTNKCIAGLELINDEKLGRIVPVDDVEAVVKAVKDVYNNLSIENNQAVLSRIKDFTFEKMAERHMEVWNGCAFDKCKKE